MIIIDQGTHIASETGRRANWYINGDMALAVADEETGDMLALIPLTALAAALKRIDEFERAE